MKRIHFDGQKTRAVGVLFLLTFFYLLIVVRLFYIQIIYKDFYTSCVDRQYYGSITQFSPRAPILDRNGAYLAMNKDSFSAFILPQQVREWGPLLDFINAYFPEQYARIVLHQDKKFIYLKRRLNAAEVELLKKNQPLDIRLLQEPGRFYPVACTSALIGVTDIDNNGIMGIELWANNLIAGLPTTYELEKDARADCFYLNKTKTHEGTDGVPVVLTIDRDLQFLVHQELEATVAQFKAKEGSVVVINPDNGEILAMTCLPQFDSNQINKVALAHTKLRPLTETYELGSVIKVCAALAALQEGVVTMEELINCHNTKSAIIDGRRINTWHEDGLIPFSQVIANSNNIGMAIVAKRLGKLLYTHYKRMGFGQKTNVTFPGEASGFLNPPQRWSKQSIISLCYGYEVSATLLQLAAFFCMIARDGYSIQPCLILSPWQSKNESTVQLYSHSAIESIKKILEETTAKGTSRKAGIRGYRIMSKTGTANLLINKEYDVTKNIYTCAGIVQKDAYQRVIVVFVKEADRSDIYASTVAAPLFERVAECVLIHDRIID